MYEKPLIRKISIGRDYKDDAMHYSVGQKVFGGHEIEHIIEEEHVFTIWITKKDTRVRWKEFNKNMAIAVEYDLEY